MPKEFIQKLTNLVEANLANENFGPEELAKEAGMSHSNLNRKLKTIINQNSSQFIREVRLKKAKELLQNEELTAAEISYRVGFGSPTYFNKCFHEYFGYAPGEGRNHETEEEPEITLAESTAKKANRKKILIGLVTGLIVIIIVTIFFVQKISSSNGDKSIAVLPFEFVGDETEIQTSPDVFRNIIQNQISKIYDLRLASENTVEQYRNTDKNYKTIGQELGVAYLLKGSLLKLEDQKKLLRLNLIKAEDNKQIWSNIYNVDSTIFSLLNKATEDVAKTMQTRITPEEKQGISKVQSTNFSAFDFYQVGKSKLSEYNPFNSNPEPLDKAQELFNKSLKCDSSFALAYAGISEIYWEKYKWKDKKKDIYLDSVLFMANRALFFDDQCADGYVFRGLYFNESGKNRQAVSDAEKALKCNPNDLKVYSTWLEINQDYNNVDDWIKNIAAHYEVIKRFGAKDKIHHLFWLSWSYDAFGFYDLSKKCTFKRLELDQDSGKFYYHMQWVEFNGEHFEEAYKYAVKRFTFEKDTTYGDPESLQYCTYSGHHEEAYKWAKTYIEHCKKTGEPIGLLHRVAYAYWKVGKTKEAENLNKQGLEFYLNQSKQREIQGIKDEIDFNFTLAFNYVMLGEKEKALENIKYVDNYSIPKYSIIFLKYDPAFNSIREDPRFQKVLKAYEAQFQAKHNKVRKWLEEQGYL